MDLLLFAGLLSTQVSLATAGVAPCMKSNCPEGYFCVEEVCKKCLKCDLLFRKGDICVTDFNKCEDCLEGYEEVLVTDYSNIKKPCKKQVKKKVKLKLCNDTSCPINNYCKEESCVKCFECNLLNRLPPTDKCAKGLDECGSCMIGYYEISVTTEAKYKPCEKDSFVLSEISSKFTASVGFWVCFLGLLVIGISWLIFSKAELCFHVVKRLSIKIFNNHSPIHPSAPPLHSIEAPEFVDKTERVQPSPLRIIEERKQQARVFKQPNASYYYYYSNEQVASGDESNDAVMENNNETPPRSNTPSNSAQSGESCSFRMLGSRYSELAVNELGVDIVEPSDNVPEESSSPSLVPVDVTDMPQPSEDNDEERDLSETQNGEQPREDQLL